MDLDYCDSFYAHLSSVPTPDRYPNNTPSIFEADLPEPLTTRNGDQWEVACTYLTFPSESMPDVVEPLHPEGFNIPKTTVKYKVVYRNSKVYTSSFAFAPCPEGFYRTPEDLLEVLNDLRPGVGPVSRPRRPPEWTQDYFYNMKEMVEWRLTADRHVEIARLPGNSLTEKLVVVVRMPGELQQALCLPDEATFKSGIEVNPLVRSIKKVSFSECRESVFPPDFLGVKCNLVDFEFTPDGRKERLLHSNFHGKDMFDSKEVVLAYKKVTSTRLDHLSFELVDQEGQTLDFPPPVHSRKDYRYNVNLGLHFRKK